MAITDAAAEFNQGVDLLQNGNSAGAIEYFRNALESEKRNPYYLSFLGVAVARAQNKWAAAAQLCEAALRFKPDEPQFYLHLAEVYAAGNRRKDALKILASARKRFRTDARIKSEPRGMGKGSGQVLPFLTGPQLLKRTLGKLSYQTMGALRQTEEA